MYNPRDIIDLIAANIRKTRNPFGIPNSQINTWWREAPGFTRRPGDALLLTGLMYQSIPYIEATTRYLERLEGSRWADLPAVCPPQPLYSQLPGGPGVCPPDLQGGEKAV